MKIYYLSFSKTPSRDANSVHVMHMCNAFAKHGHDVTLFAKKGHQSNINFFDYYSVSKSFKVIRSLFPKIQILGDVIYGLATLRKLLFLPYPDLYYGRHPHLMFFMSFTPTPLIYEVHDIPKYWFQKYIETRIIRSKNFKHLVVISEALKNEYLKLFPWINTVNIITAHDGAINSITIKNPKITIKNNNNLQVGYTGHLYPGRGIEKILEIAKELKNINFHIIGGNNNDIEKWLNKNKMPNVRFYGYVPHNQISGYLQQLDILLAPYQKKVSIRGGKGDTSKWMSPLKIFEYMAAGKPIICSDLPVLREVLTHGKTALLCDPGDTKQWINELKKLYDNKELRLYLGRSAQKEFEEKYTWNNRAKLVLRKYENINH